MWPHLQEDLTSAAPAPDSMYSGLGSVSHFRTGGARTSIPGPYALKDVMGTYFGLVGVVLRQHGLLAYPWNDHLDRRGEKPSYSVDWTSGMVEHMQALADLDDGLRQKRSDLRELKSTKEEAEAGALWDKA